MSWGVEFLMVNLRVCVGFKIYHLTDFGTKFCAGPSKKTSTKFAETNPLSPNSYTMICLMFEFVYRIILKLNKYEAIIYYNFAQDDIK